MDINILSVLSVYFTLSQKVYRLKYKGICEISACYEK